MLVFCIVFGLSMDYEVFLLSRIHEVWVSTGDEHRSVAIGIGATARVITTAAAIMVTVFASFVLNSDPTVKMLAIGMAFAVLIDASVVRMVLVPSVENQGDVRVRRLQISQQPGEVRLARRRRQQVVAAHHLVDGLCRVVHDDREVVGGHAVAATDHEVVDDPGVLAVQQIVDCVDDRVGS